MPIDSSIPLGIQQPNTMQTIASMVGIKSQLQQQQLQQQQMQANAMANQQSQIDLQETQAARQAIQEAPRDSDGNIDLGKLSPTLAQVAPKNYAAIMSNLGQAQAASTTARQSWANLSDGQRQRFGKVMTAMVGQPPEMIQSVFQSISKQPEFQAALPAIQHFWTAAVQPALQSGDQQQIDNAMYRVGKMGESASTQQGMNTPGGVPVSDGQTSSVVSTKPGTSVPVGAAVPGTSVQAQLPPTTPIVNPDGSAGYLGAQGQGGPAVFDLSGDRTRDLGMLNSVANDTKQPADVRAQARAQLQQIQGGKPMASLPVGQAENMQNNVAEMNRHFAGLQDQAAGNQLITGLTGNIKALANKAITGTDSDKLAYANGLLAALPGHGHADDLKTATDLLEKNMAQMNLGTPALTDAARALINAARPNSKMSPEAITDAADQVLGQVKANMAMRNALQGYKMRGDVQGYQSFRSELEQVADPRIWQMEGKTPQEQAKFMQGLQPADRAALVQKAQQLHQMGMIQ